jgi:hypothetical protein
MRSRTLKVLGLSVLALTLTSSLSGLASADSSSDARTLMAMTSTGAPSAATAAPNDALAEGCSNGTGDDAGSAYASQEFPDFGSTITGAADFKCKGPDEKRVIKKVSFTGAYFNCANPACEAESFNVHVFKNAPNPAPAEPSDGNTVCSWTEQNFTADGAVGPGDAQVFKIKKLKGSPKCQLGTGTYWLGIEAVMSFADNGQWGWEASTAPKGLEFDWRDAADLVGTGCTEFENDTYLSGCQGVAKGDFLYKLN